jgi:hypothetical protein
MSGMFGSTERVHRLRERLMATVPRLDAVKYERLQKKYALASLEPPSNEHMDNCKKLIESYGLKVQIH